MRNLPRFALAMLAFCVAIALLPAPSSAREPIDNQAREAWHDLGQQIEAGAAYAQAVELARGAMVCPLPGSTFTDSWGAARSGGRSHLGVDMMAPHGQSVLAPASGTYRQHGYESFYLEATNGTLYFGTHVAGHLHPDGPVVAGTPVAVNSNTGNASGGAPHLHLQIAPDGTNYENPYPSTLAACSVRIESAEVAQPADPPRFPWRWPAIKRWYNATHDPDLNNRQAVHLSIYLRRVTLARIGQYLDAINRDCSGPSDCPSLIRAAFERVGIGWRASEAISVASCESGLSPTATNGSHDGLFQQSRAYWGGRSAQYGMAGRSAYDPWANAVVSAGMVRDTGGWSHWSCSP